MPETIQTELNGSLQSFVQGFPDFMLFGAVALALLVLGSGVHILLTPMKEIKLLREGNVSAGLTVAGVIVGLAIPISSCLASSIHVFDVVIWGVVAMVLQMLAFRFVDLVLRDLPRRIERDEIGAAIVLVAVKLASALVMGAALWDPNLGRI